MIPFPRLVGTVPDWLAPTWETAGSLMLHENPPAAARQAEAYRFTLSHYRRRKFLTSGALFWMYSDCWPTTSSWTILDYYLRRKPSYYAVRRAFAPEMLALFPESEGLSLWLVNDHLREVSGVLTYGLGRFSQSSTEEIGRAERAIAANSAQSL